jgi:hypothetical protein
MADARQPRTTQTRDLSATLWSARHVCVVGRVLNLSDGGMLFGGSDLDVGEQTSFVLEGPGFQFSGLAVVAHRADHATGLRFLGWEGPAYRQICGLVAARLRGPLSSDQARRRDPRVRRRVGAPIAPQRSAVLASARAGRRSS